MIEEIETARPRIIEVKLSDNDAKSLCETAGLHGLTVGRLIENFIEDLVDGPHSNGSDERMYAQQWFERCGFGMFSDFTFLSHLIDCGELNIVIGIWEDIKNAEENIQAIEEALASGVERRKDGSTYTWKDYFNHRKGTPCFSNKEEWEQEKRERIAEWQEEAKEYKQILAEHWNEYTQRKEYEGNTFEKEMEKVLDYWKEYQRFLRDDFSKMEKPILE